MPSIERRTYLTSLSGVAIGGLAGCPALTTQSPPAGSLRFINDSRLPHAIRVEVTDVGAEPSDGAGGVTGNVIAPPTQRTLTASSVVSPADTETFDSVFTEPVWYGIQFWLDGDIPEDNAGTTRLNPAAADGGTWEFLTGHVYESGEFSWEVHTTDNPGPFNQ